MIHRILAALAITSGFWSSAANAQSAPSPVATVNPRAAILAACNPASPETIHTFYFKNVTQPSDINEIYTAMRQLMPPEGRTFLVLGQSAIALCGLPEQVAVAEKLLRDLDRPKKNYRITYTITDMDGSRRLEAQHFSMLLSAGQETVLKQNSRVPIPTGVGGGAVVTSFNYVDAGISFVATVYEATGGVTLQTSIDRSNIAEEKSSLTSQAYLVRQTTFRGKEFLSPGKSVKLGSFDVPESTRHADIEAIMEPLP